jgi:hypothetical protein
MNIDLAIIQEKMKNSPFLLTILFDPSSFYENFSGNDPKEMSEQEIT